MSNAHGWFVQVTLSEEGGLVVISRLFVCLLLVLPLNLTAQSDFFSHTQLIEDDIANADGLRAVNATAVSPDGKHLYVVSTGDFSIALYQRNISTGNIAFVEMWRDRSGGVEGLNDPYHVLVSPDGKHVYVGAYDGKSISVFDRNASTGSLFFKQLLDIGALGYGPVSFLAISPDGRDLYAVSRYSHPYKRGLSQFKRDTGTGELSFLYWYEGTWGARSGAPTSAVESVSISGDGRFVYVTAQGSIGASLSVFSRSAAHQELTLIESEAHRDGAADGLTRPATVLSSPDSKHIYVVDEGHPNGIATYAQNSSTGEIDFVEFIENYQLGRAIMTKTGSHIIGFDTFALVSFERNQSNGRLQLVGYFHSDEVSDADEKSVLSFPEWVSISPDGAYANVSNSKYHRIGVFSTKAGTAGIQKFQINVGLIGAWFFPPNSGQGFLLDVYPDSAQIFLAWFTYDTELPSEDAAANLGNAGQRWMTALGHYSDNQAILDIYQAEGGLFDMSAPKPEQIKDGTITLEFEDCNSGTVTYDIPSIGREGVIPIQRIVSDNVRLCESLEVR